MRYKRKEVIGECTLYLGDSLEVLQDVGRFDVLLTDPPYGIDGGKGGDSSNGKKTYSGIFEDTPLYIQKSIIPVITKILIASKSAAITPGVRCLNLYPVPRDMGCFFHPASMTHGPWGFTSITPILYYGKDWRAGKGAISTGISVTEASEKNGHPCPKPIRAWTWLLDKISVKSDTVIDPFLGSGTTGVACAKLGRTFTGIELDEGYFDIACKRIEDAYKQPDMFVTPAPKAEQVPLDF